MKFQFNSRAITKVIHCGNNSGQSELADECTEIDSEPWLRIAFLNSFPHLSYPIDNNSLESSSKGELNHISTLIEQNIQFKLLQNFTSREIYALLMSRIIIIQIPRVQNTHRE